MFGFAMRRRVEWESGQVYDAVQPTQVLKLFLSELRTVSETCVFGEPRVVKTMSRITVVVFVVEYVDIRTTLGHFGSVTGIHMLTKHGPEKSRFPRLIGLWTWEQVGGWCRCCNSAHAAHFSVRFNAIFDVRPPDMQPVIVFSQTTPL